MRYISFLLCTLIISCKSYRYIDVEVLNPGSVKIPQKVNNLIVIDPRKILQVNDNYISNQRIPIQDLAINSFTSSFKKYIQQSPAFATANITFPVSFSRDSINTLAQNDTTGKTLLLKLFCNTTIDTTDANTGYDILVSDFSTGLLLVNRFGYFRIHYKFQFMLEDVIKNRLLDQCELSVKFVWVKKNFDDDGSKAVIEVSGLAAKKYARRLAPYWFSEERMMYYSGNQLMRKGYKRFCENDLKGAMFFWDQLYNSGTRKLASLAAHNIALVYEMQDDLDACENWLVKSIQSKLNTETREYLEKIRKRKLSSISLDMQLSNN